MKVRTPLLWGLLGELGKKMYIKERSTEKAPDTGAHSPGYTRMVSGHQVTLPAVNERPQPSPMASWPQSHLHPLPAALPPRPP